VPTLSAALLGPALEKAPQPESATPTRERDADAAENDLIGEALRAYARDGFVRGWAQLRKDECPPALRERMLAEFERDVLGLPQGLGGRAARDQDERELRTRALDTSDAVAWLATLPANGPSLDDVATDPERFASFFRPRSPGTALDGPALRADDPLPDGAVLQFPPGVFALEDLARGRNPFPKDVTVRGAGMEATLLVMRDVAPHGSLERFTVEDCTVFAHHSLADVRSGPTVLTLRRMRLIGFDCGAGGSCALTLRASAIAAEQCRFEGGYGRNPTGLANLLRRGGPLVARFEGCLFERLNLDGSVQAGVVFADCVMNDLLEQPGPGPLYENCRITVLSPEQCRDEVTRRRDLNELFPDWEARSRRR
jgi:hypothetical protein